MGSENIHGSSWSMVRVVGVRELSIWKKTAVLNVPPRLGALSLANEAPCILVFDCQLLVVIPSDLFLGLFVSAH